MHSFSLHVVKLVECFACAKESSLFTFDQNKEENDALDEFLDLNGLHKWSVATNGLCLITSWTIAMKQHLQKNYTGGNAALKFDAVNDLLKNPNHYQLIGNYKGNLEKFLQFNDYACNSIDLLPYALANITGVLCVILQIDKNGKIRIYHITPLYDIPDNEPSDNRHPKIILIFSPSRQHYDVALTCDEYQAMVMGGREAKKVFIDLSIDEEVNDKLESGDSNFDDNDMYQNIFANDSADNSDNNDFTFSFDDKEIQLFLWSKSIKELKLLTKHHKISLVNVIEKQNLIAHLASDPTLKICVSKDLSAKQAAEVKERKRSQKVDLSFWGGGRKLGRSGKNSL